MSLANQFHDLIYQAHCVDEIPFWMESRYMILEVNANAQKKKKILFGQIFCIIMIIGLFWFINLDIMIEEFRAEPGLYWFFAGMLSIFILLLFLSILCNRRPRICVQDCTVIFYPLLQPAKKLTWSDITSRKAEPDCSYRQTGAVVFTMLGGILGHTIYEKVYGIDANTPLTDYPYRYTYYQGSKKIIQILSREMENADQFDKLVQEHLSGNVLNTDLDNGISEIKSSKKENGLFLFVGGFMAVFALSVAVFVVIPKERYILRLAAQQSEGLQTVRYTCRNVTFEISADWIELKGYDGAFTDSTGMIIYQLNGVSDLASYAPENFYEDLVNFYKQEHDPVISEPLENCPLEDGTQRYIANMKMVEDGTYYQYLTLVIFPEKEIAITFGAQTMIDGADSYEKTIIQTVEKMALSAAYVGKGIRE